MISTLLLVYKGGVMKILLPFFTPVNAFWIYLLFTFAGIIIIDEKHNNQMKNKMKKILVFMGVVAIVIGGHVYSKQSSVKMSSLMLENIEALADSETDGVHCFGKGLVDCPLNHDKVYMYDAPYSLYY